MKQTANIDVFEKLPVPRAMMVMAVPTIISQIVTLIYNLADTWFIGRTNNPYMVAACSLVLPAFMPEFPRLVHQFDLFSC